MKLFLATIIALTPTAAYAGGPRPSNQDGHTKKNALRLFIVKSMCQEQKNPGYVKSYKERVKFPVRIDQGDTIITIIMFPSTNKV